MNMNTFPEEHYENHYLANLKITNLKDNYYVHKHNVLNDGFKKERKTGLLRSIFLTTGLLKMN